MLNFDKEAFMKVMKGAVNVKPEVDKIVKSVTEKGYRTLFLVGSGGSMAIMLPFDYLLKAHSTIDVRTEIAAELMVRGSKFLNENAVVVLSSLSGTTKETVAAAKYCKEHGATTIGLVGELGTPLAEIADYVLVNYSENDFAGDSIYIQLFELLFGFMAAKGEFPDYEEMMEEFKNLPEALYCVKESCEPKMSEFAKKNKDDTYHMLVGSGSVWGETYSYGMCVLEEMQWIRTKTIHAAEFFHGTLELVEKDTSVILMKGEDETRPLMDRVERFAEQYTEKLSIFDTKAYELPGISDKFRKYLTVLVICTMFEVLSKHLEKERDHSLDLRRYYRVIEY